MDGWLGWKPCGRNSSLLYPYHFWKTGADSVPGSGVWRFRRRSVSVSVFENGYGYGYGNGTATGTPDLGPISIGLWVLVALLRQILHAPQLRRLIVGIPAIRRKLLMGHLEISFGIFVFI
jgi:hypothetical protein